MTDKKKLDEQAILNVSSTDSDGMTGETTFVADDAVALARLLKDAGLESGMFNGPATLSLEKTQGTSSVTSRISSPDLRSIMNLLEPEFQEAGSAENGDEDPALAAQRAQAHSDIDAAFNGGDVAGAEIYDPGMDPYADPEMPVLDTGANSQFSVAEPQFSADNEPVDRGMADNTLDVEVDANGNLGIVDEQAVNENIDDDQFDALDNVLAGDAQHEDEGSGETNEQIFSWIKIDSENGNEPFDKAFLSRLTLLAGVDIDADPDNFGVWSNDREVETEGAQRITIVFAFFNLDDLEEMVEDADYDYRTHDVHPSEYAGRADRQIVQPKTKTVPSRSGDDPIVEAVGSEHQFTTHMEYNGEEVELQVYYDYDSGEFDTGLDHPSTASHGETVTISSATRADTGEDILYLLTPQEYQRLEQEAIDDVNDVDPYDHYESVQSKSFKDYVREVQLSELSRGQVSRYVDKVNQRDYDAADDQEIKRRARGLGHAQAKTYWKDARVLARESEEPEDLLKEFQLNELSQDTMSRYAKAAQDSKDHHEVKASKIDDLVWDREFRGEKGSGHPAKDRLVRARDKADRTAWKREKGLDRLGASTDRMDEISQDTKDSYRDKARGNNQLPYFQRAAEYYADDAEHFDNDETRALSSKLSRLAKNREKGITRSYPKETPARYKAQYDSVTGTYDILDTQTGDIVDRNVADSGGRAMSVAANWDSRVGVSVTEDSGAGSPYEIQGSMCDYKIVDTRTGETVEDKIYSGHAAMDSLKYWNGKKPVVDEETLDEYGGRGADHNAKRRQFGPSFYLNTDCGYASLDDLGTHDYFQGGGVVILEIDRNGKKGLNYVAGHDNTKPGTNVTCITATSTGQKYRPGKVIDSFTFDEYEHDRPGLEKRLAQYGITPQKKLSVKTFD